MIIFRVLEMIPQISEPIQQENVQIKNLLIRSNNYVKWSETLVRSSDLEIPRQSKEKIAKAWSNIQILFVLLVLHWVY